MASQRAATTCHPPNCNGRSRAFFDWPDDVAISNRSTAVALEHINCCFTLDIQMHKNSQRDVHKIFGRRSLASAYLSDARIMTPLILRSNATEPWFRRRYLDRAEISLQSFESSGAGSQTCARVCKICCVNLLDLRERAGCAGSSVGCRSNEASGISAADCCSLFNERSAIGTVSQER